MIKLVIKLRNYIFKRFKFLNQLILFFTKRELLTPKIWRKIQPMGELKLALPNGNFINYYAMENDQLARSIIWTQFKDWEYTTIQIFCELSIIFKHFIDIGGYTGIYSIIYLCLNNKSEALIFEPNPDMIKNIEKNLNTNNIQKRAKVFNIALSNYVGKQIFAIKKDRTSSCLISNDEKSDTIEKIIEVQVTKYDELKYVLDAEIVKIDVEGYEIKILQGMNNFLIKNHPILILECLYYDRFLELQGYLKELGYKKIFNILPKGLLDTEVKYFSLPGSANLLCIPDTKETLVSKITNRYQIYYNDYLIN